MTKALANHKGRTASRFGREKLQGVDNGVASKRTEIRKAAGAYYKLIFKQP